MVIPCHTALTQFSEFYLYIVFEIRTAFAHGEFNVEIMQQFLKLCCPPRVKIYVAVSTLSSFILGKYLK